MQQVKSRVWIEQEGEVFLGFGRIELLKKVAETQSISAAAKAMGMSYKKAWKLINAMNSCTEKPLVVTSTGGKDGGGTSITEYGREMIARFEELNLACEVFLNEKFNNLKQNL